MTYVLIYVIPTSLLKVKLPALCAAQQRMYSFSPPFLNITNMTVFFPTWSQIHSQHWKRPSPPGSANRCYLASHRRRIPLPFTLASYSCWKLSIHVELQNSQKAGLYEEQVDILLFLISNQRYLKPQNTQCSRSPLCHLIPTCQELAAENCSISPPRNPTCQGKVPGVVLQERRWPNHKTCASPSKAPHLKSHLTSLPSYLLISCYHLI